MKILRRIICFFTAHRCRMYRDLRRVSPDRVECPCCCSNTAHQFTERITMNGTRRISVEVKWGLEWLRVMGLPVRGNRMAAQVIDRRGKAVTVSFNRKHWRSAKP